MNSVEYNLKGRNGDKLCTKQIMEKTTYNTECKHVMYSTEFSE